MREPTDRERTPSPPLNRAKKINASARGKRQLVAGGAGSLKASQSSSNSKFTELTSIVRDLAQEFGNHVEAQQAY
ncbi:hypothetical protein HN51_028015 [Arachis hypogaea]